MPIGNATAPAHARLPEPRAGANLKPAAVLTQTGTAYGNGREGRATLVYLVLPAQQLFGRVADVGFDAIP